MPSQTAPCGAVIHGVDRAETGFLYSDHLSTCQSEACKRASGR